MTLLLPLVVGSVWRSDAHDSYRLFSQTSCMQYYVLTDFEQIQKVINKFFLFHLHFHCIYEVPCEYTREHIFFRPNRHTNIPNHLLQFRINGKSQNKTAKEKIFWVKYSNILRKKAFFVGRTINDLSYLRCCLNDHQDSGISVYIKKILLSFSVLRQLIQSILKFSRTFPHFA